MSEDPKHDKTMESATKAQGIGSEPVNRLAEWGAGEYPPLDHEDADRFYSGDYEPDPTMYPALLPEGNKRRDHEFHRGNTEMKILTWDIAEDWKYDQFINCGKEIAMFASVFRTSKIQFFLKTLAIFPRRELNSHQKEEFDELRERLERLSEMWPDLPTDRKPYAYDSRSKEDTAVVCDMVRDRFFVKRLE